jgi:hypothetical protein
LDHSATAKKKYIYIEREKVNIEIIKYICYIRTVANMATVKNLKVWSISEWYSVVENSTSFHYGKKISYYQ